ncbi:Ppx/GppA phosphatase family protein [Deltaproteobacteria bacterium TL4]
MKVLGAIDIGSNAIRMSCVGLTEDGRLEPIEETRTPIRLGAEVFSQGFLSEENILKLIEILKVYSRIFEQNQCEQVRAYATSALREASNQEEVIFRIHQETGIELEVISGGKEAELLERAVRSLIDMNEGSFMIADLGGGSIEISIIENGSIEFAESFRLGTVRLLQMFPYSPDQEREFISWVKSYIREFFQYLGDNLKKHSVRRMIITGGNATSIAQLGKKFAGKNSSFAKSLSYVHKKDFQLIRKKLSKRTLTQRIQELELLPDRADVILPAIYVFKALLDLSQCEGLSIPDVGLKEGILDEILEEHYPRKHISEYQQILYSAYCYVKKYQANPQHSRKVHKLCMGIFSGASPLHHYGQRERIILELAAILHDVGRFIRPSNHHQHSMYLIQHSELVGITNTERKIVSLVARYHTGGNPSENQMKAAGLSQAQQQLVKCLASILRVADALDRDHRSAIQSLFTHFDEHQFTLFIDTTDDLLLTNWALEKKKDLFEQVFQKKLLINREHEKFRG